MDAITACSDVSHQTQEMLVRSHALLVKRIAHHLLVRLPPSVQIDDLMQAGMMGLLEAIKHYDQSKGASFETYASIRIRGHMLDEIRNNDWVPRSVYRNARVIAKAVKKAENSLGRSAKDHEVAAELGMSNAEYYELLKNAIGCQLYGFEDLGVTDDSLTGDEINASEPHAQVLKEDNVKHLATLIAKLPEKERLVLSLYYEHDLNLKEIGEVLGVSESRVCQIHTQAALRIRASIDLT